MRRTAPLAELAHCRGQYPHALWRVTGNSRPQPLQVASLWCTPGAYSPASYSALSSAHLAFRRFPEHRPHRAPFPGRSGPPQSMQTGDGALTFASATADAPIIVMVRPVRALEIGRAHV